MTQPKLEALSRTAIHAWRFSPGDQRILEFQLMMDPRQPVEFDLHWCTVEPLAPGPVNWSIDIAYWSDPSDEYAHRTKLGFCDVMWTPFRHVRVQCSATGDGRIPLDAISNVGIWLVAIKLESAPDSVRPFLIGADIQYAWDGNEIHMHLPEWPMLSRTAKETTG